MPLLPAVVKVTLIHKVNGPAITGKIRTPGRQHLQKATQVGAGQFNHRPGLDNDEQGGVKLVPA